MSATFDSDMFSQYFAWPVGGQLEKAPVMVVEGRSYEVAEYYLEDLKELGRVSDRLQHFLCLKWLSRTVEILQEADMLMVIILL